MTFNILHQKVTLKPAFIASYSIAVVLSSPLLVHGTLNYREQKTSGMIESNPYVCLSFLMNFHQIAPGLQTRIAEVSIKHNSHSSITFSQQIHPHPSVQLVYWVVPPLFLMQ